MIRDEYVGAETFDDPADRVIERLERSPHRFDDLLGWIIPGGDRRAVDLSPRG